MVQAKRLKTDDGIEWVTCGHCNHKIMKIINSPPNPHAEHGVEFECKCSSCKELNEIKLDLLFEVQHDKR